LAQVEGAICIFAWRADPGESFLLPPLMMGARSSDRADNPATRGARSYRPREPIATSVGSRAHEVAPGDGADVVGKALAHLRGHGRDSKLARVSSAQMQRLGVTGERFSIEPDRDNWDYVYSVPDLVELAGERYHSKRNHIAQFRAEHADWEYRPLTPDFVPACEELQDLWCDERHCDLSATLRAESSAVKEALRNLDRLSAVGGCILVGGMVRAFTLGEPLNADTVTIHIEKANAAYHGLYQVINQQFLEQRCAISPTSTGSRTWAYRGCGRPRNPTTRSTWWRSTSCG
jgi:hypothetical protein